MTKLRDDWTGKEKADVEEILRRLELAKKTIIDLEKKKLDLVQEEKRLSEQLEEEELACKAEVLNIINSFTVIYQWLFSVGCKKERERLFGVRIQCAVYQVQKD